jgi:hypothetical protein
MDGGRPRVIFMHCRLQEGPRNLTELPTLHLVALLRQNPPQRHHHLLESPPPVASLPPCATTHCCRFSTTTPRCGWAATLTTPPHRRARSHRVVTTGDARTVLHCAGLGHIGRGLGHPYQATSPFSPTSAAGHRTQGRCRFGRRSPFLFTIFEFQYFLNIP